MNKGEFKKIRTFFIFAVPAVAFVVRANSALLSSIPLASDAHEFFLLAQNVISGNGFSLDNMPTAYRLPGYPFLLALLLHVYNSALTVTLFQALCDSFTCYVIFRIGERINLRTAVISSVLWSLYPPAIILSSMLMSETVFTMLLMMTLFYAVAKGTWNVLDCAVMGIMIGLEILIKPQVVIIAGALFLYRWKQITTDRSTLKHAVFVAVVVGLTVAPWIIRNGIVMGSYTLSTNGGVNFWIGNNPSAKGGYYFVPGNEIDTITSETKKNSIGYEKGMEFILHHPAKFVLVTSLKLAQLFSSQNYFFRYIDWKADKKTYREIVREHSFTEKLHLNFLFITIIAGGIIGLFLLRQYSPHLGMYFILVAGLWIGVHLLYFGNARFLFPITPLFSIGTGLSLSYKSLHVTSRAKFYLLACIVGGFLSSIVAETVAMN